MNGSNMMLKGKTITSNTEKCYKLEVRKTIETNNQMLHSSKTIASVSELDFQKTTIRNELCNKQNEIIPITKNIRLSINFLKQKFPGFNDLYYIELFDLLESTDFNLTTDNLNLNIQKFINLGNNVQSQISRLNGNLHLNKVSYNSIKNNISDKMGFFCSDTEIKALFENFNVKINNLYSSIYEEYANLKNIDFNKYNLINLYYSFFFYIDSELSEKFNFESDIIKSRILSLNNSNQILEQFKLLVHIEIKTKETELENLKNYSDILKPSLYVLEHQNFKEFKEQFKKLIKS